MLGGEAKPLVTLGIWPGQPPACTEAAVGSGLGASIPVLRQPSEAKGSWGVVSLSSQRAGLGYQNSDCNQASAL